MKKLFFTGFTCFLKIRSSRINLKYFLPGVGLFVFFTLFSQTPVVVNLYEPYQTITGLGTHDPNGQQNMIVDDLGASSERVYIDWHFKASPSSSYDFNAANSAPSVAMINTLISKGIKVFFSTCFTPPPYMKMNGLEADSTCYHDWSYTKPCTDPRNKLKPSSYNEFADFLVEYARQFKATFGIELAGLSIQNEPAFNEPYVSCVYTPGEMKQLVKLVGARLEAAGLSTRIICAEDMGSYAKNKPWLDSIVADPETRKYLAAWAVHGYIDGVSADMGSATGWSSLYDYVHRYGLPLWMTETSGYLNTWDEGMKLAQAIHLGLRHGKVSVWSYCYANNPSQPQFSLMQNSTPLASYYASKHYYRYIRPGAQQVESSCSDKEILVTAFRHGKEKRLTLVIINNNVSQSKTLQIQGDKLPSSFAMYTSTSSGYFVSQGTKTTSSFTVPAKSVNTLVFTGSNQQPTIDRFDTVAFLMKKPGQPANYSISLTGISDGGEGGQNITVSATVSNPEWFSSFAVSYVSPQTTGKINFTPVDNRSGFTTVTVTVNDGSSADNGFLSTEKLTFTLALLPFINHAPSVTVPSTVVIGKSIKNQTIPLTGISDGDDGSQTLTFNVSSSNNAVVTNVYVKDYQPGGSTASLSFLPKATGEAYITMIVADNGSTLLGGENYTKKVIKVQVIESNQSPSLYDASVVVWPNPATSFLRIENPDCKYKKALLVNMSGNICWTSLCPEEQYVVDVSSLTAGVYILRMENEQSMTTRKIMILR